MQGFPSFPLLLVSPAGYLPAPWSPRAIIPEDHVSLVDRFKRYLQEESAQGCLHSDGTLKSCPRAVQSFLEHLARKDVRMPSCSNLDELMHDYLDALKSGRRLAALASEPLVARSAMPRLGQFPASSGVAC